MLGKSISLGFLLLSITQAIVLQNSIAKVDKHSHHSYDFYGNLGFTDSKGLGATQEQIQLFKSIINEGSSLYPKEDDKRLKYIADQMNKAYSEDDNKFQIFQEGKIEGARHILIGFDDYYASVAPGTDKTATNKSFMFSRIDTSTTKPYFFKAEGAKGSGITADIQQNIIRAISKADDIEQCDCSRAVKRLIGLLSNWSYCCYTNVSDIMYYAYAADAQYYSLKGPNCYFAMWKAS